MWCEMSRFFSLKGWDNIAQGNALGKTIKQLLHPEGVRQIVLR